MKEWNNPQLFSLGVENTFDACDCEATTYKTVNNEHYCHFESKWHQNNCASLKDGHDQSAKCPTGGSHYDPWNVAHKSKCCCGTRSTSPEAPDPS